MDAAIRLRGVDKSYRSEHGKPRAGAVVEAVKDLTLEVIEGEMFGLIGPDGAGKTTTMRLLCGLLRSDGGMLEVGGHDVRTRLAEVKKVVGYMPQRFSLYPDLTVRENLHFFANLYNVPSGEREERYQRLMDFSNLRPFEDRQAQNLSGGMKQKLALSCTLIHTPQVLILDEPTTGVDPVSRREFWTILKELQDSGVTILVSTPYMDEAARCTRVAFMHHGTLLAVDRPEDLPRRFPHELVAVRGPDPQTLSDAVEAVAGVLDVHSFGDRLHLSVRDARGVMPAIESALAGLPGVDVQAIEPGVEDVFIHLMGAKETDFL